tara:strand:- start:188 stop:991 length:804 start_codon:yes stop_codon:yes gene_type:complete
MFSKNSVAVPQSKILADVLNKKFNIDFRPGLSCSTKQQIDEDQNTAIVEYVTGRVWKSLQDKDGQCDVDLSKFKTLGIQSFHYDVCVTSNSPITSANDIINSKNLKIGYATGSHFNFWIDQFEKKYKTTVKKVQYTNSNNTSLAVLSGEVDVGIILDSVSEKKISTGMLKCVSFGNPTNEKSTEKLFNQLDKGLSSAPNLFVLAVKNINDEDYKKLLKQTNIAKTELDNKFKNNRFVAVGKQLSKDEADIAVNFATSELYKLTKKNM